MTAVPDRVRPDGPWHFDQDVADAFDDMLRRSIPQYEVMREAVTAVALAHHRPGSWVLDLGCVMGDARRRRESGLYPDPAAPRAPRPLPEGKRPVRLVVCARCQAPGGTLGRADGSLLVHVPSCPPLGVLQPVRVKVRCP